MTYNVGDIFKLDEEYTERANFCNENGYYIEEIESLEDGTRQFQIKKVSEPSLDEVRQRMKISMKSRMESKRESLTCTYHEDEFRCNKLAQNNMNTLVSLAQMDSTKNFRIRSATEVTHTLTAKEVLELALLMVDAVDRLHDEYWEVKDQIARAESFDELDSIEF